MPNDSSTGGYLAPAGAPAPLEGAALSDFLQGWLVGVLGGALDGTKVMPRWQTEPPTIPTPPFAAFGVTTRRAETYAFVQHVPGVGDRVTRHEVLDLVASFYDQGIVGQADALAAALRDGASVPQNLEALYNADMALVATGDITAVPTILKMQTLYRADLSLSISRRIVRLYPVLDLASADAYINFDNGLPQRHVSAHP